MTRQIVFQHTPKCGGSSVRRALGEAFTFAQLYSDTTDNITSYTPSAYQLDRERYFREARSIRPTETVICGHFPIRKYAHIEGALHASIVRHPVDRTISHYYWLRATMNEEVEMWRIVRDRSLDVAGFARMPNMRTFYGAFYFRDVTVDDFDLVLFAERFERGLERLAELVGRPLRAHRQNVTEGDPALMAEARDARGDPGLRAELAEILADEIALFEELRSWPTAA